MKKSKRNALHSKPVRGLYALTPRAARVLRVCLFLCLIHALVLLSFVVKGAQTHGQILFDYNLEALKALLASVSLSFLLACVITIAETKK